MGCGSSAANTAKTAPGRHSSWTPCLTEADFRSLSLKDDSICLVCATHFCVSLEHAVTGRWPRVHPRLKWLSTFDGHRQLRALRVRGHSAPSPRLRVRNRATQSKHRTLRVSAHWHGGVPDRAAATVPE